MMAPTLRAINAARESYERAFKAQSQAQVQA